MWRSLRGGNLGQNLYNDDHHIIEGRWGWSLSDEGQSIFKDNRWSRFNDGDQSIVEVGQGRRLGDGIRYFVDVIDNGVPWLSKVPMTYLMGRMELAPAMPFLDPACLRHQRGIRHWMGILWIEDWSSRSELLEFGG